MFDAPTLFTVPLPAVSVADPSPTLLAKTMCVLCNYLSMSLDMTNPAVLPGILAIG